MLASVSKTITGVALFQLYEDGHFQLDDPINNYLPFQVKVPGHRHHLPHVGRHLLAARRNQPAHRHALLFGQWQPPTH
ncbi:MAG: serine hydrolase [Saprospiraceae bacterium]|nr:serine hydrolase [Saprospiraceae bacterium]